MTTDPTPAAQDPTDQDTTAEATTPWFRVAGVATPEEVAAIAVVLGELEREQAGGGRPPRSGWATAARREALGGRPLAGTAALRLSDRFS